LLSLKLNQTDTVNGKTSLSRRKSAPTPKSNQSPPQNQFETLINRKAISPQKLDKQELAWIDYRTLSKIRISHPRQLASFKKRSSLLSQAESNESDISC
jgi:hypothetical protein